MFYLSETVCKKNSLNWMHHNYAVWLGLNSFTPLFLTILLNDIWSWYNNYLGLKKILHDGVSVIIYKFKASRNYIINTHLFSHYSQQRHKIAVKLKQKSTFRISTD